MKASTEQTLSSLQKLHKLTKEPARVSSKKLINGTGIRFKDFVVLTDQGIVENIGTKGPGSLWKWNGVVPNLHMVKKLLSTPYPYDQKNREEVAQPTPEPKKETVNPNGVITLHRYRVNRKVGNAVVSIDVEEQDGLVKVTTGTNTIKIAPMDVYSLKAYGQALVQAAELFDK